MMYIPLVELVVIQCSLHQLFLVPYSLVQVRPYSLPTMQLSTKLDIYKYSNGLKISHQSKVYLHFHPKNLFLLILLFDFQLQQKEYLVDGITGRYQWS